MQGKGSRRVGKKAASSQNSQQAAENNIISSAPAVEPNLYEVFGISDPSQANISQPVAPITSAPFRIRDVQIHLGLPRKSDCGDQSNDKGKGKVN